MKPNLHSIAADLSNRVPELARDSATNRCEVIERIIKPLWDSYLLEEAKTKEIQKWADELEIVIERLRKPASHSYMCQQCGWRQAGLPSQAAANQAHALASQHGKLTALAPCNSMPVKL